MMTYPELNLYELLKKEHKMHYFKNLEDVQQFLWDERADYMERLLDELEDATVFRQGYLKGYIEACEELGEQVRHTLKHHGDIDDDEQSEIELG